MKARTVLVCFSPLISLGIVGCDSGSGTVTGPQNGVVVVGPNQLEDAQTYLLSPGRSQVVTGGDTDSAGNELVTIRVNGDAVVRDTTLAIARIRDEFTPVGVVGSAFLLSPEITTLSNPIRIRVRLSTRPGADALSQLRLVRLDTGTTSYEVLGGQALLDEPDGVIVAAELNRFGVVGVVDLREAQIAEDVAPTEQWRGMHLMDLGRVDQAKAAFQSAVTADPTPEAQFALGIVRLLTLPATPELATFLEDCGEPVWDSSSLWGETGFFAQDEARGRGDSDLMLGEGFDELNLLERQMLPSRIVAEVVEENICLDGFTSWGFKSGYLHVDIVDPSVHGNGTPLELSLVLDPRKPLLNDTQSLSELLVAGAVEIELNNLNGRLEVRKGSNDNSGDRVEFVGGTEVEVGLYAPRSLDPGMIRVTSADLNPTTGVVEFEFVDVFIEPTWPLSVPELLSFSGSVRANVSPEPTTDAIALFGTLLQDDFDLAPFLAGCGTTALTDDYLMTVLRGLGDETLEIAQLLTAPGAVDAEDYRFDLSLGIVGRPGVLRLGMTEGYLLVALLEAASASAEILTHYNWYDGDLASMFTQESFDTFTDCEPCGRQDDPATCTVGTETRTIFSSTALVAALNPAVLTPAAGSTNLLGARTKLDSALGHILDALVLKTFDTPTTFTRSEARLGTEALGTFVENVIVGLTAMAVEDGARVALGENSFFMTADALFTSPPTVATLRSEAGELPTAPAFIVEPRDGSSCMMPCTDERELTANPAEWVLGTFLDMNLLPGDDVVCATNGTCSFVSGGTCDEDAGFCTYPEPEGDLFVTADEFFTDSPPFLNQRSLNEVEAALTFAF